MAVRIGIDRAAAWRDMGSGVALLMRPATSVEHGAAERSARDKIRAAVAGVDALGDIGLPVPAPEQLADHYWLIGLTRWLIATELAVRIVEDWRGVEDEATGAPAAFTRAGIADLFRYETIQQQFEQAAYQVLATIASEGKKSPPPPNGSAPGAALIANPAETKISPAQGASAG